MRTGAKPTLGVGGGAPAGMGRAVATGAGGDVRRILQVSWKNRRTAREGPPRPPPMTAAPSTLLAPPVLPDGAKVKLFVSKARADLLALERPGEVAAAYTRAQSPDGTGSPGAR